MRTEFSHKRSYGPKPKYDLVRAYYNANTIGKFVHIAGPCSVESEEQIQAIAKEVAGNGATHLRGGVFRAGTYPGSNFGFIDEKIILAFKQAAKANGLKNIIEILDYRAIDDVYDMADCFQVGARQMQNYTLLRELGRVGKTIFLKRHVGSTIDECLGACEYLLYYGCKDLYIIERGSSTYHNDVRWTPSVHAVPSIKSICDIPVIWDASHACGRRDIVPSVCLAGVAAGADGVLLEVHFNPEKSLSDADQALNYVEYRKLSKKIKTLRGALCDV